MPEIKVLHMADLHLEWPFAGAGADRMKSRLRRAELRDLFVGIIDLAVTERVDLLLIAGDLFEHVHAGRSVIRFIDDQFRRIPQTRVFVSPGNHDPYIPGGYYESFPWAPNVHIFGPQVESVDLPDLPVTVHGWGFGSWEVSSYQLGGLRVADPGRINLVVVHGGDGEYHPLRPADLAEIGADYIALGHIHQPGVLLEQGGQAIARYPGSPEALGFGEPGEHGVLLGTVSKGANRFQFIPTGQRACITRELDVEGAATAEDLMAAIRRVDEPDARLRDCYRLILTGAVDPELALDLPVLQERLSGDFFLLRLEDETWPDYDLDRLALERSARGLMVRKLVAMEVGEPDGGRRQRIRRALALGLAALEGRGAAR